MLSICNQNNIKKSKSLGENGERFCRFSILFFGVIVFLKNGVCTVHCALLFIQVKPAVISHRSDKSELIVQSNDD